MRIDKPQKKHDTSAVQLINRDVEILLGKSIVFAREWTPTKDQSYQYGIQFQGKRVRYKDKDRNPTSILKGVTIGSIPDKCWLSAYMPDLNFSPVEFVSIVKIDGVCTLEMTASLYYDQWHLACNLSQFMARYYAEMEASHGGLDLISASTCKNEGMGISLVVKVVLSDQEMVLQAIEKVENVMAVAYRETIRHFNHQGKTVVVAKDDMSEKNARYWWTERVIVPVLTSGTLAAIVGWWVGRSQ